MSILLSACQLFRNKVDNPVNHTQNGRYPAIWWEKLEVKDPPAWEIFPNQAAPGEVILSKRNELGILSNFAATPFVFHGVKYASVEGFWQMLKYPELKNDPRNAAQWSYTRPEVGQMNGFEAKDAGKKASENMKLLNIDWVTFEGKKINYKEKAKGDFYQLIRQVMLVKLRQNPDVKNILLKTGDLVLKPDHQQELDSPPAWKYFEIWMEIRSELVDSH